MFTGIPNPNGTRRDCGSCGRPTVEVTTGTGTERVHCGTYTARCTTNTRTTTAKGA